MSAVEITIDLIRKKAEHNAGILTDLQELSLHQLQIGKLNKVIGSCCKHLRILLLQNNLIPKIENLHRLRELQYLNLALNNITKIDNLASCESLQKLDLTVNFIDCDTLAESIENLKNNVELKEMYLTGNPCTTFEHYRSFVVASLPSLEKLDGVEITRSERLTAMQSLALATEKLREAAFFAAAKRAAMAEEAKGDDDDEGAKPYTPETRMEMYREIEEKKQKDEAEKQRAKGFEAPADIWKETQKKLSQKVVPPADGTLPSQRNVAKLEWTIKEDASTSDIVVQVEVPKFLDTSEIDVDIHPKWFQVLAKGKLLLLHLPEEVNPDSGKVQRLPHNGHLLLTLPKANFHLNSRARAAAAAASKPAAAAPSSSAAQPSTTPDSITTRGLKYASDAGRIKKLGVSNTIAGSEGVSESAFIKGVTVTRDDRPEDRKAQAASDTKQSIPSSSKISNSAPLDFDESEVPPLE